MIRWLAGFILIVVCGCVVSVEPDTVSSPLRVAQCRATCLEKVGYKKKGNFDLPY